MNRSHVIHARVPGALLLELYSRDGLGTMVSADFYEGARHETLSGSLTEDHAPRVSTGARVRATTMSSCKP